MIQSSAMTRFLYCFRYPRLLSEMQPFLPCFFSCLGGKRKAVCFFAVWSDTIDQWTACPWEQNWLSLWACAGNSFIFINCSAGFYTVPCSQRYQAALLWQPHCLLLQALQKLDVLIAVIWLNISNGSCYTLELSAVDDQSTQEQLEA